MEDGPEFVSACCPNTMTCCEFKSQWLVGGCHGENQVNYSKYA